MSINIPWARKELATFVELSAPYRAPAAPGVVGTGRRRSNQGSPEDIIASVQVVEQILARVVPNWRNEVNESFTNRWEAHREAAQRALVVLDRKDEISEMLGDDAPQLSAATMHPWVWSGAQSLWRSGHFREAVTAAARQVNAEAQNKVQRRDIGEVKLFQNVFSLDAPKPGQPRLRLMADDGSDTYDSVHRGAAGLAVGIFAGLRNPNSHVAGLPELPEHEALEQLATCSVLARMVDTATVETV